ncbi:MAG: hypothetical protein DMG41_13480 [Acidobacteria bacterium]|nr:MAG: hypothetical protein AUH13_00535 [Acidobacteria bacterium 13_2_20CM_58_27]PYT71783.1 MAG: hypothetical protein DMG42_15805 [Acidobacteriota bacterium]PYT88027.1 MAG: hypothetical protein DMG41_13480 [Acidobacteriota bacterium]
MGWLIWLDFASVHVFKRSQSGDAKEIAEGRNQVRSGNRIGWYRYLPGPYIRELKNFVAAGWSVREALVAATKTNAEILDMDDRLGTLAPGKLADVLVVDGRLDENLDELSGLDLVIRDGYTVVEGGKVTIPRHLVTPQPKKAQ